MRKILSIFLVVLPFLSVAQFAPPAGQEGSTAINADSPLFVGWATGCVVERGPVRIDKPQMGLASYGVDADALGKADDTLVVSLGDGGNAVLTFASPIYNGEGPDFAVFENPLKYAQDTNLYFLELGFVEVSSDGENYVRFPAISNIPFESQVGTFTCQDPKLVHNFAGKYAPHYGTPFDLDDLPESDLLDLNKITHVRIVDVVGTIRSDYATYDSEGHVVNDPWPTPFESCGFDLDAVGVIHDLAHSAVQEQPAEKMVVAPNPVSEVLYVQLDEALEVSIYALTGQQVLRSESPALDVSALPAGVYFARVVTEGKSFVQKFVKK